MQTYHECIYCNAEIVGDPDTKPVPAADDDEAWKMLAYQHAAYCEWIETRAHQLPETGEGDCFSPRRSQDHGDR